jgi:hypothetical protein
MTEYDLEIDLICIRFEDEVYSIYYEVYDSLSESFHLSIITMIMMLLEMKASEKIIPMIRTIMEVERDSDIIHQIKEISELSMLVLTA